jgi:hypothetical protein
MIRVRNWRAEALGTVFAAVTAAKRKSRPVLTLSRTAG